VGTLQASQEEPHAPHSAAPPCATRAKGSNEDPSNLCTKGSTRARRPSACDQPTPLHKRPRRGGQTKVRLKDVLANETDPIVLCEKEYPHRIVHPNQPWLEMCGYTLEEVEGLTNKILTGPETDPAAINDLLECVRRREPSVQTLVNYKKVGVRFVNQVQTLPVYDEHDELAAFMSLLNEVDAPPSASTDALLNPGHAHLWAAVQLRFELTSFTGADSVARHEACRTLLTNHQAVLADMTNHAPVSQLHLERLPSEVMPYADQVLREVCRRLLGCPYGGARGGILDERLEASHPLRDEQRRAWSAAATFLDRRIQTGMSPSGRTADMSEEAAAVLRAVLREVRTDHGDAIPDSAER